MLDEIIIPGVGDISRDLEREFRTGFLMEAAQAKARQIEAADIRKNLGLQSRETEMGRLAVQVDPFWYHYWGQREGYEIWQDEKEVATFVRDTPELRIEREKSARVCFAGCSSPILEGKPQSREDALLIKR